MDAILRAEFLYHRTGMDVVSYGDRTIALPSYSDDDDRPTVERKLAARSPFTIGACLRCGGWPELDRAGTYQVVHDNSCAGWKPPKRNKEVNGAE